MAATSATPALTLDALRHAVAYGGIDNELALEDELVGNAYLSDKPRAPATLREAGDLLASSAFAREAFGPEVVEHYLNDARVKLDALGAAVTDWERSRGFERL